MISQARVACKARIDPHASPEPSPEPEHDLLVFIDVPNDLCPGDALAAVDVHAVVPAIAAAMPRVASLVFPQGWHPPGHHSFASAHPCRLRYETVPFPFGAQIPRSDHCVQGVAGVELLDAVR